MSRPLAVLVLLATAHAGERAFVETDAPATRYVHQPFTVRLRVGLDTTHAVQIFPRRFDLPVQVDAPWLDGLEGAVLRPAPAGDATLVLNGDPGTAAAAGDRDGLTVVEIERTYVPTRPGPIVLAAPRLRHATATRFRDDFIHGRVPLDRRDETTEGAPRTVAVLPLPKEGRPAGFAGAVGRFTVGATAAPVAVDAGAPFRLVLRIEGEGNLERFDTPRLDDLDGFHVYGMIDDRRATPRRTIAYEIAPLTADVTEVPALPFVFFDPDAAAYRTVRTRPIPLTVRGANAPPAAAPPAGFPTWPVALGLAAIVAALLGWRRARRGPSEPPAPDAAAVFRANAGADLADAFTAYLATRLGCPPASVIAPDLADRLRATNVPPDLAARVAAHLERLVAARYGGAALSDARAETHELVDRLESAS